MRCVFSTLPVTVDGILEEVFCQYNRNFNSRPIVELIFKFTVIINGFYTYKKYPKLRYTSRYSTSYDHELIYFDQEREESGLIEYGSRPHNSISMFDLTGAPTISVFDWPNCERVKFINFNQIQLNINGDIVQIVLKSKLIFEKDESEKIYEYTKESRLPNWPTLRQLKMKYSQHPENYSLFGDVKIDIEKESSILPQWVHEE